MSFSLDPDDASGYIGTEYCFEMEFLVAKKLAGYPYSDEEDIDSGSDESSLCQLRWFCPADAVDDELDVLRQCEEVFSKNNQPVEIMRDNDPVLAMPWDYAQPESWILQPARFAHSSEGSPEEYDWVGVRLRSPLFFPSELENPESNVKWCIGALRMALLLHVNSTCPFDVLIRTTDMALTHVKKVVTLVWLLERDLLLTLRPDLDANTAGRMPPITTHSAVATRPLEGVENSRPRPLAFSVSMDRHVPRLHDDATQERLQRLWACASLGELIEALCNSQGQSLAFSLYGCPEDDAGEPASACVAAFRYGLWHPYDDVDVSNDWIELALTICRVMQVDSRLFKSSNRHTDHIIQRFEERNVGSRERWKPLAERLSFSEEFYAKWNSVIQQYRHGGQLARSKLDEFPALGQIPELHMYRSR